jgi:hypothetical protein
MGITEGRGSGIAAGQWQCVHMPKGRVFKASYRTFIGMLHAENRIDFDPETEYPIYSAPAPEGDGICFFFSPPAAQRFKNLIKFWGGFPFQEPKHLKLARRIL